MNEILREGKKILFPSFFLMVAGIAGYFYYPALWLLIISAVAFILFGYTIFFLRPPRRTTFADPNLIYASADGYVMEIQENVQAPAYLDTPSTRVVIFMHVASMHWNLSPIEGDLEFAEYHKGQFKNALTADSWQSNEHQLLGIHNKEKNIKILISMVAGLIARRIRFLKKAGDKMAQGDTFGLIKYGSANILYLPQDFEIVAKKGQKSRAGITVIAKRKNS